MSADGDFHREVAAIMEALAVQARDLEAFDTDEQAIVDRLDAAKVLIADANGRRISWLYGGDYVSTVPEADVKRAEEVIELNRCNEFGPDGNRCDYGWGGRYSDHPTVIGGTEIVVCHKAVDRWSTDTWTTTRTIEKVED